MYLNNVKYDAGLNSMSACHCSDPGGEHTLTWKRRQDAGVGAAFFRVLGRVFGLKYLVEVKKFPVPPVDQVLTPPFSLHLNHKPLERKHKPHKHCNSGFRDLLEAGGVHDAYEIVNEAFLLLSISNGGTDGDVVRELIKITDKHRDV